MTESRQRRRRLAPSFRKPCRNRSRTHLPQFQPLRKNPRTCFEGPFGEVIRATGPMAKVNPFRFSTKYQDDEADLLYYGYRYYNASAGRWLSRDPAGEDRGELNLYGFVSNDPLNSVDEFGLMRWQEVLDYRNGLEAAIHNTPCCCIKSGAPRVDMEISGTSSGATVTGTGTS
jgi:RHS repeat-associated protein